MIQDREILEQELAKVIDVIRYDTGKLNEIKRSLFKKSGVLPGKTQEIINGAKSLEEIELSLLCLLAQEVFRVTDNKDINPAGYFTKKEIDMANRQDFAPETGAIKFPIVIDDVLQVGSEDYITVMSIQQVVEWYNSNLLEYNFETQRNAKFERKRDKIIQVPNIKLKSVKEITEHLKNNTYLPDTITFNVLAGSGEDDEVSYDRNKKQLIIKESEIDILDGFHRINAFAEAYREDPNIDFSIQVSIKNYSLRKAQAYVAQINTINKMDVSHLKSLKADRYGDFVTKEIQRDSDLRGRVSQTSRPSRLQNQLVSYAMLADSIDETFDIESKKDAMDLSKYLIKFFDYLIGSYPEEFIEKVSEYRKMSIINHNFMFAGYVVLAKRMKDEGIEISRLPDILGEINFSKDDPQWSKIGVINSGKVDMRARANIKKFFNELDLVKYKEGSTA